LQDAINHAGRTGEPIYLPAGQRKIDGVVIRDPVRIVGSGSTLLSFGGKSKNGITITERGSLAMEHVTLDACHRSAGSDVQASKYATIMCESIGGNVELYRCKFIGGRSFDVRVFGQPGANSTLTIDQCRFAMGIESTEDYRCDYVRCHDNVDVRVTNSDFVGTQMSCGRSGIMHAQTKLDDDRERGSLMVFDCRFVKCGYNSKHTVGAIDAYSGVDDVVVTGNTILHPFGRGICAKADASGVIISGNIIKGLHGESATAGIALFGSKLKRVGGERIISGNTISVITRKAKGILVDGSNVDEPATAICEGPIISGNQIKHNGTGVMFKECDGADVIGNRIIGMDDAWKSIHWADGNSGVFNVQTNRMRGFSGDAYRVNPKQSGMDLKSTQNVGAEW
jgi:hypothetical protein